MFSPVEVPSFIHRPTAAMLFSRASPKPERAEAWDIWEVDKHMHDLVRAPGIHSASLCRRVERGASAFRSQARRAVVYRAENMQSMRRWLDSEGLAEAVEDGRQYKDALDPVDDQWFTGNIYSLVDAAGPEPRHESHLFSARFEVPKELRDQFERWLAAQVQLWSGVAGAESVRSFRAERAIANVLYLSEGSHSIQVSFPEALDPVACLEADDAFKLMREAHDWALRLDYAACELFTPVGHAYAPLDGV